MTFPKNLALAFTFATLALQASPARALYLDDNFCEHATYFSGCSKAWMAVRVVTKVMQDSGCADATIESPLDQAKMEINHCTRPQGIYDLALAPVKAACAEWAAVAYKNRVVEACRK